MLKYCIFIPCYKAAATIGDTIKGVQDAIIETGIQIPVYIYDDCGGDESLQVAKNNWNIEAPLNVTTNHQNWGERKTTNTAIKSFENKYDWVFIIHADDIPKKNWLLETIKEIENNQQNNLISVWSSFDTFLHGDSKINEGDNCKQNTLVLANTENFKSYLTNLRSSWHISGCSLHIKNLISIGCFDETMPQFGDLDLILNALSKGFGHYYIAQSLTKYRLVPNSVSSVSYTTNRDLKEMGYIQKSMRRI